MHTPSIPHYEIDTFGDLVFRFSTGKRYLGNEDLALAFDPHGDVPCLHTHGPADEVIRRADRLRNIDPTIEVLIIPREALRNPDLAEHILDEINACLNVTGRVGTLKARLEAIDPVTFKPRKACRPVVTVIIRRRDELVPASTAEFGYEAIVNGQLILATDAQDAERKAQAREAELRMAHV